MPLRILMTLFLGSDQILSAIPTALFILGLFMMFPKSGVRGWHALIPGLREYQLARCAGCESDAPFFAAANLGMTAAAVASLLYSASRPAATQLSAAQIALISVQVCLLLTIFIYSIRVYTGLVEVYGVRKLWLVLWLLPGMDCIPALIWGFSKSYQPGWKVQDIRAELSRLAHQGSAPVTDEGLTVNLKDYTVAENLSRRVLLRDIHMTIPRGRMVLLLGGSDAGRTAFLKAVTCAGRANAQVMLNGEDLGAQYKRLRYEVGFVPRGETMRGRNTVLNTLKDIAKLRLPMDADPADRAARVAEVMDSFGLTPMKSALVEKLSVSQKKCLSISMELISNPTLFTLDEPDADLDSVMARELFVQLRGIADTGRIVIAIAHAPDSVIDLFDDVIVLASDDARTDRLAFYGSVGEARRFFGCEKAVQIVKAVGRKEEGGDGLAEAFVTKYAKEVA